MELSWLTTIVPLAVFVITLWLTGRVAGWLRRRAILDQKYFVPIEAKIGHDPHFSRIRQKLPR